MAETDAFHSPKTRKLQLLALTPSSIPSHPHFNVHQSSDSTSLPALVPFITEILNEGIAFSDKIIPEQFVAKRSPKDSPPSAAKVKLLTSDVMQSANGQSEAWFARQSLHDDKAQQGTGTYLEFENGLMHNHSIHEAEYTPNVMDANKVADWTSELLSAETQSQLRTAGFDNVAMEVYEMCHKIPSPLSNRVFSVLVTRARTPKSTVPEPSFVVVQIPIQLDGVDRAKYSLDAGGKPKQKVVQGVYCAVERVKRTTDGKVNWEMATASDAKGNLPMALQKMGVPGAVIKDVGFFFKWVGERRGRDAADG